MKFLYLNIIIVSNVIFLLILIKQIQHSLFSFVISLIKKILQNLKTNGDQDGVMKMVNIFANILKIKMMLLIIENK